MSILYTFNEEYYKETTTFSNIHLYTTLIQGMSTTFINQTPTHLLFKGTLCAAILIFNTLPPSVTILKNDKANFKAALGKY
jgi:hypothetical protein